MKTNRALLVVITLIVFAGSSAFAGALDNWHWRNPLPNGNPSPGLQPPSGVVYTNGLFLVVGAGGVIYTSPNATNWTQSTTATTNSLKAVIYADGKYIAVGDASTVETSPDGTNWTVQRTVPPAATNSLWTIAAGGGKFVAAGPYTVITSTDAIHWSSTVSGIPGAVSVAYGNAGFRAVLNSSQVYASTDGSTWTAQTVTVIGSNIMFTAPSQNSVVTYFQGAYLVASSRRPGTDTTDEYMFRSTDGSHWTTNYLGNVPTFSSQFQYGFFMDAGSTIVLGGANGYAPFYQFSNDGLTWSTTNLAIFSLPSGVAGAYGQGTYVVAAPPSAYTEVFASDILISTDGVNWTNTLYPPAPPTGPTLTLTTMAFTNGIYLAGSASTLVRSTDDATYTNVSTSPTLTSIITYGSGFIGAGPGGNIYVSNDGLTWTQRNSSTTSSLHGIASSGSFLVAVGDGGTIQSSPVGTVWTSRTSGTSLPLFGITYANGLFVTVGKLGTVLTSPDGINWTGQYSGQINDLRSLAYGSAGYVAVGVGGTILTSPDTTNWTAQTSGTANNLESISFANGYYLAVGDGGVVLVSMDGTTWTPLNVGLTAGPNLYSVSFLNHRFDVAGAGGIIIESDVINPLFALKMACSPGENIFTLFATPGSNFRLQGSTTLLPNSWSDVATFNNVAAITGWTNSPGGSNLKFFRTVSP